MFFQVAFDLDLLLVEESDDEGLCGVIEMRVSQSFLKVTVSVLFRKGLRIRRERSLVHFLKERFRISFVDRGPNNCRGKVISLGFGQDTFIDHFYAIDAQSTHIPFEYLFALRILRNCENCLKLRFILVVRWRNQCVGFSRQSGFLIFKTC